MKEYYLSLGDRPGRIIIESGVKESGVGTALKPRRVSEQAVCLSLLGGRGSLEFLEVLKHTINGWYRMSLNKYTLKQHRFQGLEDKDLFYLILIFWIVPPTAQAWSR